MGIYLLKRNKKKTLKHSSHLFKVYDKDNKRTPVDVDLASLSLTLQKSRFVLRFLLLTVNESMWAEKQVLVMNKPPEEATRGVNKRYSQKFPKYTGKHLCQSLFFNKVAGLWHRCLPVNFPKFLRTPFLQKTSGGCF